MIDTTQLYGIIAQTMPTEGRDFTITVTQEPDQKPKVAIAALTNVGRGFVPALISRLSDPLQKNGVSLTDSTGRPDELTTINKLREQAELESAATVKAKIESARKEAEKRDTELAEARKARIAKSGEQAKMSQEERKAISAMNYARNNLARLEKIVERIPKTRKQLEDSARAVAENEEKQGNAWAVDMDAPITTLFDKQDAIQAFRLKEEAVQRLAALSYDTEATMKQAIDATKRFIINRKA